MVGDGPAAFDPTELFFASFFPISFFAVILYLLLYSSTCHHIIIFVHHCICGRISVFVAGWAGFPEAVVDYGQPLQEQTISTVPQCNANVEAKIFWFLLLMLKYCIFKLKYIYVIFRAELSLCRNMIHSVFFVAEMFSIQSNYLYSIIFFPPQLSCFFAFVS